MPFGVTSYNLDGCSNDWDRDFYPEVSYIDREDAICLREHGVLIPKEIEEYAKKRGEMGWVETWYQEGQRYQDWHYSGPHRAYPNAERLYDWKYRGPENALILRDFRDYRGFTIKLEIYRAVKSDPNGNNWHKLYQQLPEMPIYEWRNNGNFMGVYHRHPDVGPEICYGELVGAVGVEPTLPDGSA